MGSCFGEIHISRPTPQDSLSVPLMFSCSEQVYRGVNFFRLPVYRVLSLSRHKKIHSKPLNERSQENEML